MVTQLVFRMTIAERRTSRLKLHRLSNGRWDLLAGNPLEAELGKELLGGSRQQEDDVCAVGGGQFNAASVGCMPSRFPCCRGSTATDRISAVRRTAPAPRCRRFAHLLSRRALSADARRRRRPAVAVARATPGSRQVALSRGFDHVGDLPSPPSDRRAEACGCRRSRSCASMVRPCRSSADQASPTAARPGDHSCDR